MSVTSDDKTSRPRSRINATCSKFSIAFNHS